MPATNPDIRTVHISELKPDPENARRHNPRNVGQIERSISTDGFGRAGLLAEDLTIAAGNATADAAASVGMEEVIIVDSDGTKPVYIRRTDLKAGSTEFRRLALSDNRAAELADWDADVLQAFLDDGLDLEQFWFPEELEAVLAGDDTPVPGMTDPDEVPEPPDDPITKPGDLWLLGEHRLLCGDSTVATDVHRLMAGRKADMVFTDPPYGVDYVSRVDGQRQKPWGGIKNDELKGTTLQAFLRDAVYGYECPRYVCCNWQSVVDFFVALGKPNALIVWDKGSIGLGAGYRNQHEFILFYGTLDHNSETNVWQFGRDSSGDYQHPTQKPVELIQRAIQNSSKTGDLVLDLFGGSGSTLIAAEQTGRTAYMMELDPKYCDVIVQRYEAFTGNTATRETPALHDQAAD